MKNNFKGGVSSKYSAFDVAKKWKISPVEFMPILEKGTKHEMEHTDDKDIARIIALDHIVERLDYYDQLDKIEKMHLGGDMSKHLAPNGKPSNLTHEQWHLVRTPEFKAWFGDWENDPENASKVVDENGEPLVVHHGSIVETNFDIFDYKKADLGFHFGTKEQAKNRVESKGVLPSRKSIVNSFFLNIRVLFEMTDVGEWQYPQRYIDEMMSDNIIEEKVAKQKGFLSLYMREDNAIIRDYLKSKYGKSVGFVYNNKYEGKGKSFIVLSPNQIKLADGTNTTFDSGNPEIRFDKGGELINQKIIDVAKSVVRELGEIYSENDYVGKCKEISEEISNRLNELDIYAIPMRIIEGEDTKYNSLVFNHAYTFLPDKNYIVDTQLWQLEGKIDDLTQRKVLFTFDEYNDIVKLYEVEPIEDWEERFDKGGATNTNFNDKELLKRYKKGESIGFTAIAHLKAQGLIERSDGTKRKSLPSYASGGRTIAQTPAPSSDKIYGSKTNPKGSASDTSLAKSIKFNDSLLKAIENKVKAHNEEYPSKKVTIPTAKAVVRRGMGAYSKTHRPFITGGAPNSRQAWGLARLNKFLLKKRGAKVKSAYIQDDDLL